MSALRAVTIRIAAVGTVTLFPLEGDAQERGSLTDGKRNDTLTTAVAGQYYATDGWKRTLLGTGWRDVWVTPISVPPLRLGTYAGGLKVLERGGGYQSMTLHLQEESGWKEYRFRSANKFPGMTLPGALHESAVGRIIQDQVSAFFPGAPVMVTPMLDAIKALHVDPKLYRLADDRRLGVYRDTMGGMLGTMELKPNEAPNDKPGFEGSAKIQSSDDFFKELLNARFVGHALALRNPSPMRAVPELTKTND